VIFLLKPEMGAVARRGSNLRLLRLRAIDAPDSGSEPCFAARGLGHGDHPVVLSTQRRFQMGTRATITWQPPEASPQGQAKSLRGRYGETSNEAAPVQHRLCSKKPVARRGKETNDRIYTDLVVTDRN